MSLAQIRAATLLSLAAFSIVACGGGTATLTPPKAPSQPQSLPNPVAASSTTSVPVGLSSVKQSLPLTGGILATIAFPAANQAVTMNVTVKTGAAISPSSLRTASLATKSQMHRLDTAALPQGPYLVDMTVTPDQTVTFDGPIAASFDIGPLLSSDAKTALSILLAINPQMYVGLQDPAGNFTAVGPVAFDGTTVSAAIPTSPITLQAGTTYHIGLHVGPLTSATAPPVVPSATPTPTPTAPAPTPTPPTPTATPTPVPTNTPPSTATQTILAAGFPARSDAMLTLPYAGGFSGAIGYPANDSNVVSVLSTSYNGTPMGAPSPSNETVDYAIKTMLAPGAPANQPAITFQGSTQGQVNGSVSIPFDSTTTFTVFVYAPGLAGNTPIYTSAPMLEHNRTLTFSSPFNAGQLTVPVPTTVYVEVAQP